MAVGTKSLSPLERRVIFEKHGKTLWLMRRFPAHAARWLTGIALPPHERYWVAFVYFAEHRENNTIAGRGTSKSFTGGSLAQPLKCLLYKNVGSLLLSASGFRGGKELLRDAERLILGQLRSQELPGLFFKASISSSKPVQKDPSIWSLVLKSHSRHSTVPTNNPEQLRGLRATEALIDERNTFADDAASTIIRPMLAVGTDFRRTAHGQGNNKIFQISTIDFTVRGWYKEIQVAEDLQKREYAAWKARKEGDWEQYDRLMNEKDGQLRSASFTLTRFDYTDLLIPEYVRTLDGEKVYRIEYPREPGIERDDILVWDINDKIAYWYTYPVDKQAIEQNLRDGTVDVESWLAEHRNVFIRTSGNVFDYDLIQRVAERPIPIPGKKKRKDEDGETEDEYFAPLLMTCGDPCILGVDVARESDETTFVVIRLGPLASGEFEPFFPKQDKLGRTVLGRTDWSHICWAESHKKMEQHEAAKRLRELFSRYRIIKTFSIGGVAMDWRGGGSDVRDNLGNPKPDVIDGMPDPSFDFKKIVKIFDPEDKDDGGFAHFQVFEADDPVQYWGGLKLLMTTNDDNRDWTMGAKGLMQQKKLYIAYWLPPSKWAWEKGLVGANGEADRNHPDFKQWEIGYNGIRRLKAQLLRLQQEFTKTGLVSYVMPGDRSKEEGKKDLWAAMIYAVGLARQHLNAETQEDVSAPMVEPLLLSLDDIIRTNYNGGGMNIVSAFN